ncbi:MAG: ABC transporter ATP-binding protein [Oligoflexus sp.]
MTEAIIHIQDVEFSYPSQSQVILSIAELSVNKGERVFIHGPSGCGKSSLLGLITGILTPKKGRVQVLGRNLAALKASHCDRLRGDEMGYIFQMFNLLPYLDVKENIALPCRMSRDRRGRLLEGLDEDIHNLAKSLGIDKLLTKNVTELSVGQQQRVAAARALLGRPPLLIADEPTSALDFDSRESFIRLLFDESEKHQISVVFVSHDHSLGHLFDRQLALKELNRISHQRQENHSVQ